MEEKDRLDFKYDLLPSLGEEGSHLVSFLLNLPSIFAGPTLALILFNRIAFVLLLSFQSFLPFD